MNSLSHAYLLVVLLFAWLSLANADFFCGERSCYDVLNVAQNATNSQIKKAFYKLSLTYHPDKNKSPEAEDVFRSVATAYEVLSVEKTRKEYDDVLQHPERYWRNYYAYARYRYGAGHIPVWKVLTPVVILCTIAHWMYWQSRYQSLRRLLLQNPKVQARLKLANQGQEVDLASVNDDDFDSVVQIGGWQGRPPTWKDLLPIKIALMPLAIHDVLYWHLRWMIRFSILKQEYGVMEQGYLTAQALQIPYNIWSGQMTDEQRAELLERQLWIPQNLAEYRKEMISARKSKKRYGR